MFSHYFDSFLSTFGLSSQPIISIHSNPTILTSYDSTGVTKKETSLREIVKNCSSLQWYRPTFWLANGHASTIFCTLADTSYDTCHYSRTYLRLPDGGTLGLDFSPPLTASQPLDDKDKPLLVMCHGLTGGSHESYVIDLVNRIGKSKEEGGVGKKGFRSVVVNFRGCAGTPITSKQLYHGGYTDDLRCALAYLSHAAPNVPLYGVGFSLGANVMAKYCGEEGEKTPLKGSIILGGPWDFIDGHVCLSSSWIRGVYSKAMAQNLRRLVERHRKHFESDPRLDLPALFGNPYQTLYEFDSLVTRVLGGFKSTEAYYRYASANQYAHNVAIPLLSINAMDDPIVSTTTIPTEMAETNPNLVFITTASGGHLGWWTNSFQPRRWISLPCTEWLAGLYAADPVARPHLPTVPPFIPGETTAPKVGDEMVVLEENEMIGFKIVEIEAEIEAAGGAGEAEGMIKGL